MSTTHCPGGSSLLTRPGGKLQGRSSRLLTQGNGKLGRSVFGFSLPAVRTCPGMTPACRAECYARRNNFRFPAVETAHRLNLAAAKRSDFASRIVAELGFCAAAVVRIHVAGDFFSAEYAAQWVAVALACPRVTFFGYSRSWRVASIRPVLEALAAQENVALWYSADRDTGLPGSVPPGVGVAWLETQADEDVPPDVDLVFRPRRLRKRPNRKVPLPLVCPADVDGAKVTCAMCGSCWQEVVP